MSVCVLVDVVKLGLLWQLHKTPRMRVRECTKYNNGMSEPATKKQKRTNNNSNNCANMSVIALTNRSSNSNRSNGGKEQRQHCTHVGGGLERKVLDVVSDAILVVRHCEEERSGKTFVRVAYTNARFCNQFLPVGVGAGMIEAWSLCLFFPRSSIPSS